MNAVVFKRAHIFFSQFRANSLDEAGSRRLFFPLFSGALWTPFRPGPAALPGRARILLLAAPGPRPPYSGPWALDPGHWSVVRATMGSEMEPLLRAWSYFRRRKFQLCADLCTQMLEKSPYDQVPADPRKSVNSLAMAMGSGGSLCPLG